MAASALAAHRLPLTGPEWVVLCRRAMVTPPTGFGVGDDVAEDDLRAAVGALSERGVLDGTGRHPHRSVAANLAVWAAPAALMQVEVSIRGQGLRAAYGVRGPLGASVFALPDGGVELSMFPAIGLGDELVRCVPDVPRAVTIDAGLTAAFGRPPVPAPPPRGRLPLSVLAEYGAVGGLARPTTAGAEPEPTEASLAAGVAIRTVGVLRCVVLSGGARGSAEASPVLAAEVVWLATDAGWLGLRPQPDGSGRQLVDLVPADRRAFGSWLAPYLARILEAADG